MKYTSAACILIVLLLGAHGAGATWWANVSEPYVINTTISGNGSGIYQYNITLHDSDGTNNNTDIFDPRFFFNYPYNNYSYISTNVYVVINNTNDLPTQNKVWWEFISGSTARVWFNVTNPGNSSIQYYFGGATYTYNNTLGGNKTFRQYGDVKDAGSWILNTGGAASVAGNDIQFSSSNAAEYSKSTAGTTITGNWTYQSRWKDSYNSQPVDFLYIGDGSTAALCANCNIFNSRALSSSIWQTNSVPATTIYGSFTSNVYYTEIETRNGSKYNHYFYSDNRSNQLGAVQDTTFGSGGSANTITAIQYATQAGTNDDVFITYEFFRDFTFPEPRTTSASATISWSNNITNDNSLAFSTLSGHGVEFNFTVVGESSYAWTVNGTAQASTTSLLDTSFPAATVYYVNASGVTSHLNVNWTVTVNNYTLEMIYPTNTSSNIDPATVNLIWREWPQNAPFSYQVSTDPAFINIVAAGVGTTTAGSENVTATINLLSAGVTYYWHVQNNSGVYLVNPFEFTTTPTSLSFGSFNITLFDEQNWTTRIGIFSVTLYNTTAQLTRSTTNGWVNFTNSEVTGGQYLLHIIPNSTYATRYLLETSPGNVTAYSPSTITNTIDTVNFYLYDYTGLFPSGTSVFTVFKNNTMVYSSYFDQESKVSVNLIQGDAYVIQVTNGNNIYSAGEFYPIASGPSNLVILNLGYNQTKYLPFSYAIKWNHDSNNNITTQWQDLGTLINLSLKIYKGDNKASLVYSLFTSLGMGAVTYTITNTSDIYYVDFIANTTNGQVVKNLVFDYRIGSSRSPGNKSLRSYGTFTMPDWALADVVFFLLLILAGSFGAVYSGFGAIVLGLWFFIFWAMGLITTFSGGAISIIGALLFLSVLIFLKEKEKT